MLNKRSDLKINNYSGGLKEIPSDNKMLLTDLSEPEDSIELISAKMQELNTALLKEINELKKANLELNRVLDNVDECIYSVDTTTYQFIHVSLAAEKVYGYTPAEFYANSKLWYEIIIPEDKIIIDSTNEKVFRGEWVLNQFRIIHKNGSIRWLESKVIPILNGKHKLIRIDGVVRDITDKKEGELKIIESEKYLAEAQRLAKMGSWNYDIKADKITWSDELYNIFGADKQTFTETYNSFLHLIDEEDREFASQANRHIQETGESFSIEYRITTPNGEKRIITENGYSEKDENGKITRLFGTAQNITDKKESELKIIESEKKYHYLFENNPAPMWVMEVDSFKFLDVNNATLSHYGYSREEFLSLTALDLRTKEEQLRLIKFIDDNKDSDAKLIKYNTGIWKHKKKDGSLISVDIIRHQIVFEGKQALLILVNDITEKLKTQASLQKSEANLLTILNNTNISYILMDADLRIVSFNKIAYDSFKSKVDKLLLEGENIVGYLNESGKNAAIENYKRVLNGEQISYEGNFTLQNGIIMWYNMQLTPVMNNNHVLGMIMAIKDITNLKMAELEREKITADLIQRNNDLEQFTYIISHNLRSPVANIMGFAEAIVHEELGETEKKEVAVGLFDSVHRLDEVIYDLNNILKVKSEVSELKESVKLSSIVNDIEANSYRLIEKENAVIKTDFTAIDELFTLKSYIHSIFFNLISNSIKYRRPGINPIIEIKSIKINGKIILSFKDNGLGIDLAKRGKQVFGLYKRFHTQIEGKGMGLYMVKTQVETLGGHISIKSEVNKGTEFTIEFAV